MAKKVLVVLRVSTDRQSVESQKTEMQAFCIAKGFKPNQIEYIESAGASARTMNQKYLQMIEQMKSTLIAKDIKAVALWHLNRLGRRESKLNELKQWFIDNGINVLVKNPDLSLFDDDGKVSKMGSIFYSFLATSIEFDTSELMEKTRRGRERNSQLGKFTGGAYGTLYGYAVNSEGYIVESPSESAIVNEVFEMYASGEYSITRLAKELSDRGYTFRGRKVTDSLVARTISQKSYLGEGKFTQIISRELWDRVRAVGAGNAKAQPKDHATINIASKLIKCSCCGENYVKSNNQYVCYRKKFPHRFAEPCTEAPAIAESVIDKILLQVANMYASMDMFARADKEKEDMRKQIAVLSLKTDECVKKLRKIDDSLTRAKNMHIDGDLTAAQYTKKKESLTDKKWEVETELQRLNREKNRLKNIIHDIDTQKNLPWKIYKDMSEVDDKEVLRAMIKKYINSVTLHKDVTGKTKFIRVDIELMDGKTTSYAYYYTFKQKEGQIQIIADF